MKRIVLASVLMASASQIWADDSATTTSSSWDLWTGSATTSTSHLARRPYLGLGLGGMAPVVNKSHHVYAGPGVTPDYYKSDREISDVGFVLAAGGVTWVTENAIVPYYSFGLRYNYVSPFDVKGYIVPNSVEGDKNYFYHYRVSQQNIFGTAKINFSGWFNSLPYFLFGVGLSINQTSDYEERPINATPTRPSPGFGTRTNTTVGYIFGLGLDYILKKDLWISAEYNYGYYGNISTGNGNNTTSQGGPNYSAATLSNRLTGQSLLVGLNYYLW